MQFFKKFHSSLQFCFFSLQSHANLKIYNSRYKTMKFNLDNLVEEFAQLEQKLTDPEIFKDQKKVREVASRKKSIELIKAIIYGLCNYCPLK